MREFLKLVGACFLLAVMVYSLFVLHTELLFNTFVSGFNKGKQECSLEATYIVPRTEYEDI